MSRDRTAALRAGESQGSHLPAPDLTVEQVAGLVRMADDMIELWVSGYDVVDIFDCLKARGLITQVEGGYDPDKHGDSEFSDFLELGDEYYEPAPWLTVALNRIEAVKKAEGLNAALPDSEAGGTPNPPAVLASKGA